MAIHFWYVRLKIIYWKIIITNMGKTAKANK